MGHEMCCLLFVWPSPHTYTVCFILAQAYLFSRWPFLFYYRYFVLWFWIRFEINQFELNCDKMKWRKLKYAVLNQDEINWTELNWTAGALVNKEDLMKLVDVMQDFPKASWGLLFILILLSLFLLHFLIPPFLLSFSPSSFISSLLLSLFPPLSLICPYLISSFSFFFFLFFVVFLF